MNCNNCSNCNQPNANKICSLCKNINYCSKECQSHNWKNHKSQCFDLVKFKNISYKLDKIGLIRHVNGNTLDNRIQNLNRVSVIDSIKNKDWVVDAVCHLSEDDFNIWAKGRKNFNFK